MFDRGTDYFWIMFSIWVIFVPLTAIGIFTDRIEINLNNNYLDEYNQCQSDLERTQVICPDVQCSVGIAGYLFPFFTGAIIMFFVYDFIIFPKLMQNVVKRIKEKKSK